MYVCMYVYFQECAYVKVLCRFESYDKMIAAKEIINVCMYVYMYVCMYVCETQDE